MKNINIISLLFWIVSPFFLNAQSIVINEFSNGPDGGKEYIEFIVTGDVHCDTPPDSIDLRHWIFDDNNGYFANGSGKGIAQGACRFTDNDFWKAIPTGTLILIYSEADKNLDIPDDDLSMSDGNCRLVMCVNSTFIDRHEDLPSSSDDSYATTGWKNTGAWTHVSMSNSNDTYQIRDINDMSKPVHAVGYGNNNENGNEIIYFSGVGGQKVFYFDNTVDDDPFNQASWVSGNADGNDNNNGNYENGNNDQTPGRPNSVNNENWIIALNHNCTTPPTSLDAGEDQSICKGGSADLLASGGGVGAVYSWDNGVIGSSQTVSPTETTTYIVTMTENGWCISDTVKIIVQGEININISGEDTICKGSSTTLTVNGASGSANYEWSNGFDESSQTVSPISTTMYIVTVTEGSCIGKDSITVEVIDLDVSLTGDTIICKGNTTNLMVSGGSSSANYIWSNGFTGGDSQSVQILSDSLFIVLVTDNTCMAKDSIQIKAVLELTPRILGDTLFCQDSIGVLQTGIYTKYLWSTQDITSTINVHTEGYYSVTVTDKDGCEGKDSIWVNTPVSVNLDIFVSDDNCNKSKELTASPQGGITPYTYLWSNGETTQTTVCLPSGIYQVTVTDRLGCIVNGVKEIIIPETDLPPLQVPTIFSPNGDAQNDTWRIKNIEYYGDKSLEIEIYDRWGNIVFTYSGTCESYNNPLNQWDGVYKGKDIQISSFVYIVLVDGKSFDNGIVSIVR